MWKLLRSFAACSALAVAIAMTALWVQSYRWGVIANLSRPNQHLSYATSGEGRLRIGGLLARSGGSATVDWTDLPDPPRFSYSARHFDQSAPWGIAEPTTFGFAAEFQATAWRLTAPYWSFALASFVGAVLLKPKPRLRFSLGELMLLALLTSGMLGGAMLASAQLKAWSKPNLQDHRASPPSNVVQLGRSAASFNCG